MPGSIVMGAGIAAMHYVGMEAMRLAGMCQYNFPMVALSVALAIVISFVALYLVFQARMQTTGVLARKIISALVMGAAIPVMHYTGMAAASFHGFECGAGPFARGEHLGAGHGGNHDGDANGAGDRGVEFGVRSQVHGAGDGTGAGREALSLAV